MREVFEKVILNLFQSFNGLVLLGLLFIPLERLAHIRKQAVFRKLFLNDVFYYFLTRLLSVFFLGIPFGLIALVLSKLPLAKFHLYIQSWNNYLFLTIGLIVGEIGTYWGHRLMHQVPILWRIHKLHHSAEEMDWLVNVRVHPMETIFLRMFQFTFLYLCGFIAFGEQKFRSGSLLLLIPTVNALWGYFIHSNIKFRFGFLEYLITTPAFHHWHHTHDSKKEINKNFSFVLPIIDKIFGTFYLPKHKVSKTFGVDNPSPNHLSAQLIEPFLKSTKADTDIGH